MSMSYTKLYEVELEQQNRELRSSRLVLEEVVDLYSNLYDLAPVPYLTLDLEGCIRGINLTGAKLLQEDRDRLIGIPFTCWLPPGAMSRFFDHLLKHKKGERKVVSKLLMHLRDGKEFTVILISNVGESFLPPKESGERVPMAVHSVILNLDALKEHIEAV